MPLPLDTDTRNALVAREVATAWLLELFCEDTDGDPAYLRGWDKTGAITYDSQTFEALGDQWGVFGEIKAGADLVAEPLTIWFDGVGQSDDASFIGRLLDRRWHQRKVRLRQLLLNPSSNFVTAIGVVMDWRGFMDQVEASEGEEGPSRVLLRCESGTFRARARNMTTVTDRDQRMRDADDGSFRNIATKPFQSVPFGTSWSNIPGYRGGNNNGGRFGSGTPGNLAARINGNLF
jgi:hypothetical protein